MGRCAAAVVCELSGHDGDGGPEHHGFVVVWASFVVADQAAVAQQPAEGAFDDPAVGQHGESGAVITAFDDGQGESQNLVGPADQATGIATISPDQGDGGVPLTQAGQQPECPVTVL